MEVATHAPPHRNASKSTVNKISRRRGSNAPKPSASAVRMVPPGSFYGSSSVHMITTADSVKVEPDSPVSLKMETNGIEAEVKEESTGQPLSEASTSNYHDDSSGEGVERCVPSEVKDEKPDEEVKDKKEKRRNGVKRPFPDEPRQRNRITRNCDDAEVLDNYVDSRNLKQPRTVQAPCGGFRQPFVFPKTESEKEKDRLKIHMVGPKPRPQSELLDDRLLKPRKRKIEISIGPDFQASFENFYAESFDPPSNRCVENIPDRDELVWIDHPKVQSNEKELDDAWNAIRRQYMGKIGLDSMLRRLMDCKYDVNEMIGTIEYEQFHSLSQPFEKLNLAQQKEFERLLRKPGPGNPNGKHREGEKIFRLFQEKFLRTYYLGEIVSYYYDTKHKGCFHQLYGQCTCRERIISEKKNRIERYECANCTKYITGVNPKSSAKLCAVCDLYKSRNKCHREIVEGVNSLFGNDEKVARTWHRFEKENKRTMTADEVLEWLEVERRESLIGKLNIDEIPGHSANRRPYKLTTETIGELTQKFVAKPNLKCSIVNPWGSDARKAAMKTFSPEETLAIVKAFHKHGLNYEKVSIDVALGVREVEFFYKTFKIQYRLDKVTTVLRREPEIRIRESSSPEYTQPNAPKRKREAKELKSEMPLTKRRTRNQAGEA